MDDITRRIPVPPLPAPSASGLVAHGVSECGPYRAGNEDTFAIDLDLGLFVVADGMGGHAAGEIASRLAVESIVAFVTRFDGDGEFTWPFEFDGGLSVEANRLRTALHLANRRVIRAAASHPDYTGMGTTVAAALFTPSSVVVAHAGDSRIYQQSDGRLTPLTRDDSLAAWQDGDAEPAGGAVVRNPPRNLITNALGGTDQLEVHVVELPRAPGTRLLLCSDGVHGPLDDARIDGILAGQGSPRQQAERLVAEAIAAGGRDNATALVVADREAQ